MPRHVLNCGARGSRARGGAALLLLAAACNQLKEGVLLEPDAGTGAAGGAFGSSGSAGSGGTGGTGGTSGASGSGGSGGSGGTGGSGGSSAAGGAGTGGTTGSAGTAGDAGSDASIPCSFTNTPTGQSCALDLPSCRDLDARCGATPESCCTSTHLPGGEFIRSYDVSQTALQDGVQVTGVQPSTAQAALMQPFWLDRYEVTVGRFRKFLEQYPTWRANKPFQDDGSVLDLGGSGWNVAVWSPSLPDVATLKYGLTATQCGAQATWTDDPSGKEDFPITCVSWFVAYAFCIWDGGRLPTEAEWNYAAAGGAQQRAFPWSSPPEVDDTPLPAQANLQGVEPKRVGAASAAGRWGHFDLAGNAYEWTRDGCTDCNIPEAMNPGAHLVSYLIPSCTHCVQLTGDNRIIRGGSFKFKYATGRTAYRAANAPRNPYDDIGFRCARNPARP